jgi:hypothetical protein
MCQIDHTREFHCDDLAPRSSGRPAPPPFDNCPVKSEAHTGAFEPVPPVSVLDPTYTEYMRKRTPPGHVCCFSWCSPVPLAAVNPRERWETCQTSAAFREQFCMGEPEGGTSAPAGRAFPMCPAGIVPPAKVVFSVPKAALFDERVTSEHRSKGYRDCCYSWCSQAPPTSGLQGGDH